MSKKIRKQKKKEKRLEKAKKVIRDAGYCIYKRGDYHLIKATDEIEETMNECAEKYANDTYHPEDCIDCPARICILNY